MNNIVRTQLTPEGKNFIRNVCINENQNNRLLTGNASKNIGNKIGLPNTEPPTPNSYVWVCKPKFPDNPTTFEGNRIITTGTELAEALIIWFNTLGKRYQIDANIMAAQAYVESKFQLWTYSSTAMGISQFTMETIYTVLVNNFNEGLNNIDIQNRNIITSGLTNPLDINSYRINEGKSRIPNQNKAILHQNLCDNPQILLEAQFKYMRRLSDRTNNLASSALFCYNRGSAFAMSTYSTTIEKAKNYKSGNDSEYYKEGVDYVLKTFIVLGDKSNALAFNGRKTKTKNIYFGYDHLFKYIDNKNEEFNQLIWENNNFQVFDANIQESEDLGIDVNGFENNVVVEELSENPKYKFIYFPEENYNRAPVVDKTQVVLHHTVSSDDPTGNINHWIDHYKNKGHKVSTAFIINRRGNIYQLFLTDYWGLHIGADEPYDGRALHERSIGIELSSWGGLIERNGQWSPTIGNDVISQENIEFYPDGFFGFNAFEKYTSEQLSALETVLLAIKKGHPNINFNYNENMFGVFNEDTKKYELSEEALTGVSGIWSHTAYRKDKSDVHPQPELISMLRNIINKISIT